MSYGGRHGARGFSPSVKRRVRARRVCASCGARGAHEVDHIVAVTEGGSDSISNAQLLCSACHNKKTQAEARRGVSEYASQGRYGYGTHPFDLVKKNSE